ncbi:MAG: hypothetical protein ACRCYY_08385 [Trueperaceae bacterium]
MKNVPAITRLSALVFTFVFVTACAPNLQIQLVPNELPERFTGQYLAALSDGDWLGQTYADNVLPLENPDIVDTLLLAQPNGTISEVKGENASNAVTGTPEVMDITLDGEIAFISELDKQRPAGATKGEEIPEGDTLRALSLQNPAEPTLVSSVTVANSPNVVKVNPAGNLVAIGHQRNTDAALTLVAFENNALSTPQTFSYSDLGFGTELESGNIDVDWHPSGEYISVISSAESSLKFFGVTQSDNGFTLTPWGNTLKPGNNPNFGGDFTPDGRFLVVVNANTVSNNLLIGYLFNRADSLSVIRVGEGNNPEHEVIEEIRGGSDDEAFAISPDGRYIVTVNQYGTYVSRWTPGHNNTPELRLFELTEEGNISLLETYDFVGYLSQGVTFDTDGDTLAVSVSQRSIDQSQPGGVYFYALETDDHGKAKLEQLPEQLTVMRGVHELEVR